ncbi:MAG: response regulator [Bdellovibrionales bacterium]|nr:response regulator [Bdellovibrionales bacterium]
MKSILVIDDDHDFRETICDFLLDANFDVWDADCPDQAFKILERERQDLIICDLNMPFTRGKNFFDYPYSFEVGKRTIRELGWVYPRTPIIAMSAAMPHDLDKMRKELGGITTLPKPCDLGALLEAIMGSFGLEVQNSIVH